VGDDTLDRLTVYGELARAPGPEQRRRLFLALDPVWRSINGHNLPTSPYRRLIALDATRGDELPAAREASLAGVPPDSLEPWLLAILAAWRAAAPDSVIEPWDWYYSAGRPARELGSRVPRERLVALNAAVYRAAGADLRALNVRYDLEPHEGKTRVAFCPSARGRDGPMDAGRRASPRCSPPTAPVGSTISPSCCTRPGTRFTSPRSAPGPRSPTGRTATPSPRRWPTSSHSTWRSPPWQWRWLGDSVPLADGLRARYGGIVLDVAWSLFELRMLREPSADPNEVWTRLTSEYLRVRPHPELSWWAMRGQLVDSPGYMMNYAVGAMLIAALRARTVERHGPWIQGDMSWYPWVSRTLFRYGLERPTREVVEEFLGGPVTPAALLKDMGRMKR
jgi:hypothetical protein